MAEGKKGFILYSDQIHSFEHLEDDEAGRLIKHIFRYVNDQNPEPVDKITKIAFEPIKQQLKRDLKDWESTRYERSESGRLGGLKSGETRRKQAEAKRSTASKNEANEAVTDIVTVKERVNTDAPADLSKSNLFRQPKVPTKEMVWEVFMNHGGTKEMAKKFFDTHESTGWFLKGSPITNFSNLVPGYVQSWKDIKNGKENNQPSAPKLRQV